jgi:hypothetical protein
MPANTIVLKGKGHHDEARVYAALSPGMGCGLHLDTTLKLAQEPLAQAEALKGGFLVAKEDALQGKTVDDAYAAADVGFYYVPLPGDEIQVLTKSGEDIALGDKLVIEGGGSGYFVEAAGTETKYQVQALEAKGVLGAHTLIAVKVL